MKMARWVLALTLLLGLFAAAGCQERETRQARVRWTPTETGWYHPDVADITPQQGK